MITSHSVKDQLKLLEEKKISFKELIREYLSNIKRDNNKYNAIVSMKDEADILDEAQKKDNNYIAEQKNQIRGMPIAIKDITDVEGLVTTYGLKSFKNNIPKKNALIVDRLISNGAIIIGKTNTAELAMGSHTINNLFGPTGNYYNENLASGGSSGGAATAIAASMIPFADGTDMMGSCRNPAAFSNLYGFRPTPGLIPEIREDNIYGIPPLTTMGVMARNPFDMSLLLDVIVGKHEYDPMSFNLEGTFSKSEINLNDLKIIKLGWLKDLNKSLLFEKGIISLCEKSLSKIEKIGVNILQHELTEISSNDMWDHWINLRAYLMYSSLIQMEGLNINEVNFPSKWEYEKGKNITEGEIKKGLEFIKKSSPKIDMLFQSYDFLVLPSAQIFPFDKNISYPKTIEDHPLDTYHRWMEVTILASIFQLPSISIPIGFNDRGLPMGMQIIAPRGNDLKLIAFAKKFENMVNNTNNNGVRL